MGANGEAVALDVSSKLVTYCLVAHNESQKIQTESGVTVQDVQVVEFMTEKAAQKATESKKVKDEKTGQETLVPSGFTILLGQSYEIPVAKTAAGIAQVVPSEVERVKLFERGKENKAYQLIRAQMLEQDEDGNYVFQEKEGTISLAKQIAEESRSRATDPESKLEKVLDDLDDEAANAILTRLLAKRAAAASQAPAVAS